MFPVGPSIINPLRPGDLMAPEGSTVKLTCNARGHPNPSIVWKRENGLNITLKSTIGGKTHGEPRDDVLLQFGGETKCNRKTKRHFPTKSLQGEGLIPNSVGK